MKLHINGNEYDIDTPENTSLLDVLRIHLKLTGSKYGCGEGICGACRVLIDGHATASCITPVGSVQHKEVVTIEGLAKDGRLHPVQQAFLDEDAFQCAYCTSGMIISAVALTNKSPKPSRQEIIDAMQINICRCCAYPRIIEAISNV
ncbi:Aerobic-type carbon monoxide dehydrogenase, small subunit, CoxS/CutS family [Parapedobacter luteus]|uniref:Aerobic-type carbon monoxide dehydrogenase, small subunit, CoxS/CutS family n=1 Tax=Parapedobacter luteus TaxID=623280 RepID=A0A1T5B1Z1_9SPHI|nr:(2Fe-2S)-binding protein [Parapedobacter luteus]SKB41077.1 Aerobic-type carbon monoxide dehydrogenase, small subunit, CoxS/CutS family [Parapedobacter luteus]